MKKITLNVDAIEVSTFDTAAADVEPGTVVAHGATKTCAHVITCLDYTCIGPGCWQ